MAGTISKTAQPSICVQDGITGETSHSAVASSSTPKNFLTASIQGPTLGSSERENTPTTISGAPMPSAMANSAAPPSAASRVWAM